MEALVSREGMGQVRWRFTKFRPMMYSIMCPVSFCIFRDVTVGAGSEQQIRHSSNTDFLTGLYSPQMFLPVHTITTVRQDGQP